MEFFESKEEILDIQLTEYGKQKIARGTFKPAYYAFYDSDVIYDTAYGGYSEDQNNDQDRIFSTPRMKLQTNIAGMQSTSTQDKTIQAEGDKFHILTSPIGTSESGNENAPAWSVRFFNENLTRVVQRPTGSYFAYDTVPQLNVEVKYRTFVNEVDAKDKNLKDTYVFPDGTFIDLEDDSMFIRIVEHNTPFAKDNFEIEVFELETQTTGGIDEEFLTPLQFASADGTGVPMPENTDMVEYFLDIDIDTEVDSEEFCAKVPRSERTLYFVDRIHDCEELEKKNVRQDIYDESESGELC